MAEKVNERYIETQSEVPGFEILQGRGIQVGSNINDFANVTSTISPNPEKIFDKSAVSGQSKMEKEGKFASINPSLPKMIISLDRGDIDANLAIGLQEMKRAAVTRKHGK